MTLCRRRRAHLPAIRQPFYAAATLGIDDIFTMTAAALPPSLII